MERLLWGRRYFSEEATYQIRDCFPRADFFMGRPFNVIPAPAGWRHQQLSYDGYQDC